MCKTCAAHNPKRPETKRKSESALDILRQAIETEMIGKRFYTKASERIVNENGKRMFHSIIADEQEHINILEHEYEALVGQGKWASLDKVRGRQPGTASFHPFPDEEVKIQEIAGKVTSDLDALDVSMDLERRGYDLYKREANKTGDANAKSVYEYLAQQENEHFSLLQKTRNYLASNGAWLWDDLHPPMLD